MTSLDFMKQCLINFNYPNIHGLSEEAKLLIFSTQYRSFLVLWLFKQFDPEYGPLLENLSKESLGNIVQQHGFCTTKQKLPFITGELPPVETLDILYRMFKYMTDISVCSRKPEQMITNESITSLKDMDINLFPDFGPKQILTPKEISDKITEYNQQFQEINELLKSSGRNSSEIRHPEEFISRLRNLLTDFEVNIKEFQKSMHGLSLKNTVNESEISLASNTTNLGQQCNENIKSVRKFITDMHELKAKESGSDDYWNDTHNESLRVVLEQIVDVLHSINIVTDF